MRASLTNDYISPQRQRRSSRRSRAIVLLFISATALAAALGCTTEPIVAPTTQTKAEKLASRDDLTLAFDSLRKLAEGGDQQAAQRTIYYLNQWLATEKPSLGEWKPDRMVENMARVSRTAPGLERLDELEFKLLAPMPEPAMKALGLAKRPETDANDLSHLQTSLWLNDIAQRVRTEAPPPLLADWLREVETSVGLPEAERLAAAERVFDWTIRNIQLDELPPAPAGPTATAGPQSTDPISPALIGEPGPGYRQSPLEVLIHGHGDAWERARVFILLCRQLKIDAVMLGIMEETSPVPRGWVAAVPIKNELYLFDTTLGLPLPAKEARGIATLSQVQADPALLRRLDVEGLPAYPVNAAEVKNVVALIDADPAALSRRMLLLESALPSNSRIALACQPSQLEPELRKCRGVALVSLWRVPFEAAQFGLGRMRLAAQNPEYARQFQLEMMVFDPAYQLLQGRNLHIQGRYSSSDDEQGARTQYLSARPADREIDALESSEFVRAAMGLQQTLPADETQQRAAIDQMTTIARTRKHHATYWLGLTYYDAAAQEQRPQDRRRSYETAIEWLGERTVPVFPPSPWIAGARYNLARTYEQLGDHEAAIRWLKADTDSPQRRGNLLRAKMIEQQREQSPTGSGEKHEPSVPE